HAIADEHFRSAVLHANRHRDHLRPLREHQPLGDARVEVSLACDCSELLTRHQVGWGSAERIRYRMIRRHRSHTRSCNGGEVPLGGTTQLYASRRVSFGFRILPQTTRKPEKLLLFCELKVSDEVTHALVIGDEGIRGATSNPDRGPTRRKFKLKVFSHVSRLWVVFHSLDLYGVVDQPGDVHFEWSVGPHTHRKFHLEGSCAVGWIHEPHGRLRRAPNKPFPPVGGIEHDE